MQVQKPNLVETHILQHKKWGIKGIISRSEFEVVLGSVRDHHELTDNWHKVEEFSAALVADSPEVFGFDWLGGDLSDKLSSVGKVLDVGEEGDVKSAVHAEVRPPPAVRADEQIAATPVEEKHPSVDDSTKSLKENAVDPAPDSEGQMGDVDNPNENAGTE